MQSGSRGRAHPLRSAIPALALAISLGACASLSIDHKTQSSGTFRSTGWALTILSFDIPRSALAIARENASDARMTNVEVSEAKVVPFLGYFDWLLDIIGIRYASVEGTWGSAGKT
jgi:hypothetical protein